MAAKMTPVELYLSAGINPKTGLPIRFDPKKGGKNEFLKMFRIIDEQDAVNRYKWRNLPLNLSSQELERLIYYKGQLAFFFLEEPQQFYILPYALSGTIDAYGRFNQIHPVPFSSGTEKEKNKTLADFLSTKIYNCIYEEFLEEPTYDDMINSCVLLHDYTKQLSETIIPRQAINDPLLSEMADIPMFMKTALLSGTGVRGIRVADANQEASVQDASRSLKDAALNGEPFVAITGDANLQELTGGQLAKAEEYMLSLQSLDNLRLSTYGIDNGGLFEKKAHQLQVEANMNNSNVSLIYNDGLKIRQHFCNIVNSIWDLGIWCEASEDITGLDANLDGKVYDEETDTSLEEGGSEDEFESSATL